jgi:hypothetical protein
MQKTIRTWKTDNKLGYALLTEWNIREIILVIYFLELHDEHSVTYLRINVSNIFKTSVMDYEPCICYLNFVLASY